MNLNKRKETKWISFTVKTRENVCVFSSYPGVSLHCTGDFFMRLQRSKSDSITCGSVCSVAINSTWAKSHALHHQFRDFEKKTDERTCVARAYKFHLRYWIESMKTRKTFLPSLTNSFCNLCNTQTTSITREPSIFRSQFIQPPKQFLFHWKILDDRFND